MDQEDNEIDKHQSELPGYDTDVSKAEYIVEELKLQILDGRLTERTKLPSERELSEQFRVSRMTARRALQMLEGEGLVTRYPVRGTFVGAMHERLRQHHGEETSTASNASMVSGEELRAYGSFIKAMQARGYKPEVQFLEQPSLIAASTEVAEHLHLSPHQLVLKRYRLQLADKLPYRLIESYYPADLFGELLTTNIGDRPLFDWLEERHGLMTARAREVLIARRPNGSERAHLKISLDAPVVAFDRTVWAQNGRIVERARIIAVAGLYE
nr:GntR family transcriptional regulator [Ktedonobacteraceae bacterium]